MFELQLVRQARRGWGPRRDSDERLREEPAIVNDFYCSTRGVRPHAVGVGGPPPHSDERLREEPAI